MDHSFRGQGSFSRGFHGGMGGGFAPAFDSTEQAIQALSTAVNQDDKARITQLLGPVASSGDMVQDKADRELFIRKFSEMHRLVTESDGTLVLYNRRRELAVSAPAGPGSRQVDSERRFVREGSRAE